jgi:thermolysin
MLFEKFNYEGLDGKGGKMSPVVHVNSGSELVNAFWSGGYAFFGNGDCHHNPLTTLSIVGHEFTHGIITYNSQLFYFGEPGAINESYADILGKASEYYYDPSRFSWELDPLIKSSKYPEDVRSFSNPNRLKMPKAYNGLYWETNADVHVNSSILNHW